MRAASHVQVTRILRQDTSDSFRLFEILEKFLYQPEVFRVQSICQLALPDRLKMAEKYYELDDAGGCLTGPAYDGRREARVCCWDGSS